MPGGDGGGGGWSGLVQRSSDAGIETIETFLYLIIHHHLADK